MRSVWWEDNTVKMIDQRKLPAEYKVVAWSDYHGVARGIKEMYVRGAPAIGAAGAFGLALAALNSSAGSYVELLGDLERAYDVLLNTRPTAVNLRWSLDRLMATAQEVPEEDPGVVRMRLLEKAQALADEDIAINRRMGRWGAALLRNGDTVLTHCNTGALATVGFGTALGVVRAAIEEGKNIRVLADETRPRLQGARLTTWELIRDGISVTLIVDSAAGHFMRRGEVNIVLVGADRIAANGDVANKIGTYQVAVLARENGVPFYVVAPTSSIDLTASTGDDIPIEEREPEEILYIENVRIAPSSVKALNPVFDITPSRYITGIVTENGVVYPPFDVGLRRLFSESGPDS
jgi:methylthioribose-1-phosphate isomerase